MTTTTDEWLDSLLADLVTVNTFAIQPTETLKIRDEAKLAILSHFEKQAVERERAARLDEVSRITRGKIMGVGDVMAYRSTRIAALNNSKEEEK